MEPQKPQNRTPETEIRIGEVADKLLQCWRRIDICKKYATEWNVEFRMVDEYIKWAKEDIRTSIKIPTEELIAERIAEYQKLHVLALADKQFAVAKGCMKDISELQGLLIQRVDMTSGGKPFDKIIIEIVNPNENR